VQPDFGTLGALGLIQIKRPDIDRIVIDIFLRGKGVRTGVTHRASVLTRRRIKRSSKREAVIM
jgi:hypothetical protein